MGWCLGGSRKWGRGSEVRHATRRGRRGGWRGEAEHHVLCLRKTARKGIGCWRLASLTGREGSEDALWLWEGIHTLGVCTETPTCLHQPHAQTWESSAGSFSTPRAHRSFCSHELSAPSSLGQHFHLQPAQWLHDRPSEARSSSASSTCFLYRRQVPHIWARTASRFPCSWEKTSAFTVSRIGLLQLHHKRCEADSRLSRARGADPSHDAQEVQDSPCDRRTTAGVVRCQISSFDSFRCDA